MTPDGRITSEFDDVTIDDAAASRHADATGADDEEWDEFDDGPDEFPEGDDRDEDDLADLELVVLGLTGTTLLDDGAGAPRALPGAEDLIHRLRATGVKVAIVSGSPRPAVDLLLDAVGWTGTADAVLTPEDSGRAQPFPDLPLTALLRTGASSVEGMVVVDDTADGIAAGIAAGAGLVVGVLTGADGEDELLEAGADAVLPSVADLPELLGYEHTDADRSAGDAADRRAEGAGAR
ncbi:HAD family hydrolase [Leifsonia sp. 22587]|uniref:HAD family hydrolase n=1 Tax=Leifsonia sp. 22587 TaxID=3453946 RepID=UPI003F838C0E